MGVLTYGRYWRLDEEQDQRDLAFLLVFQLQPDVIHCGTPCTKMCICGKKELDRATKAQNAFTYAVCKHQVAVKRHASVENPDSSLLWKLEDSIKVFGTAEQPRAPWRFYESHGCQLNMVYPGKDDPGEPIKKAQKWAATFSLESMQLKCRKPLALLGCTHEHREIRGRMNVGEYRNVPVPGESPKKPLRDRRPPAGSIGQ